MTQRRLDGTPMGAEERRVREADTRARLTPSRSAGPARHGRSASTESHKGALSAKAKVEITIAAVATASSLR
jgi:hypothetical protein